MMVGEVAKQFMAPADVVTIQNVLSTWDKDFPNTSTTAAIWADQVKCKSVAPYCASPLTPSFSMMDEWHYIDLPLNVDGTKWKNVDASLALSADSLAINFLETAFTTLTNTKSNWAANLVLRQFIHIFGYAHQPLHAVGGSRIKTKLLALADPKYAVGIANYFKSDYSHGDVFIGLKVPQCRAVVRAYLHETTRVEVVDLLYDARHELRKAGGIFLVEAFKAPHKSAMWLQIENCSSSEDERDVDSGADEQWDDMAIVRAFEDALNDQRQRTGAVTKTQKVKSSRSTKKQSRRVSVDDEDAASSTTPAAATTASPAYGYTGATSNGYQQDFAAQPQSQANGYAMPNAFEHGSQNDIYQLAYAQAYASLQAQFQAAAHQPAPTPYPTGYGYGAQQAPGYPSYPSQQHFQPQMPQSMPMPPFPTVPGVNGAPGASDDGLSNLLLAWYQSGYYTGRFQAMQEMKARSHR